MSIWMSTHSKFCMGRELIYDHSSNDVWELTQLWYRSFLECLPYVHHCITWVGLTWQSTSLLYTRLVNEQVLIKFKSFAIGLAWWDVSNKLTAQHDRHSVWRIQHFAEESAVSDVPSSEVGVPGCYPWEIFRSLHCRWWVLPFFAQKTLTLTH